MNRLILVLALIIIPNGYLAATSTGSRYFKPKYYINEVEPSMKRLIDSYLLKGTRVSYDDRQKIFDVLERIENIYKNFLTKIESYGNNGVESMGLIVEYLSKILPKLWELYSIVPVDIRRRIEKVLANVVNSLTW